MNSSLQDSFNALFETFNQNNITYVIPRKFERVPEGIETNKDVDVYVRDSDFNKAISLINSSEFQQSHSSEILSHYMLLINKTLSQPLRALKFLLRPNLAKKVISTVGSSAQRDERFKIENIMLDVRNHLAYASPMKNQKIRVDPFVEDKFFDRRKSYKNFYIASPPDELAHIVCRYVFDKGGGFSSYYRNRCRQLIDEITENSEYDRQFKKLLQKIFFQAFELVYDLLRDHRFNDIRQELYRFSDY